MSSSSQKPGRYGDQQEFRFPNTAPGQATSQAIGGPPQWSPPPPRRGHRTAVLVASGIALALVVIGVVIAAHGSSTPKISVAAPTTTKAPQAPATTPLTAFTLPAYYAPNTLAADPGCVDYDAAWATFDTDGGGGAVATAAQETSYVEKLGRQVGQGASVAQDPTLAAGLRAEAAFFQTPANAMAIANAALDSSARSGVGDNPAMDLAMQPISSTDTYLGAVCGYAG